MKYVAYNLRHNFISIFALFFYLDIVLKQENYFLHKIYK